tara:strand:- start:142145 stop:142819 length:675 start_codon:yes stop_codon:yes gene_type:complete
MDSIRLRYQTMEIGNLDIHLRTLRDNQQFSDNEGVAEALGISSATWPLFGVVWDSGHVLAQLMSDHPIANKRILEIGCGIGLASLVLNEREADITATDYHPEAGDFLSENVALNSGRKIPFVRTGWADIASSLGRFDMLIGSDLLYEQEHAELLAAFVQQQANPTCEVLLVDPGRGHHARFSRMMVAQGFTHSQAPIDTSAFLEKPFGGQVLRYARGVSAPATG